MYIKNVPMVTQLINLFFAQFNTSNEKGCLVGNPDYKLLSNGKVSVSIPYYCSSDDRRSSSSLVLSPKKSKSLGAAISRVMQVEFITCSAGKAYRGLVEVRVIKLRYPYLDGSILAKYTALNSGKYAFSRIHKAVFKKRAFFLLPTGDKMFNHFNNELPYRSKGLKLELAGRLTTQQSIPRKTVANKHIGSGLSTAGQSSNTFSYASKNKLGAYTIKV